MKLALFPFFLLCISAFCTAQESTVAGEENRYYQRSPEPRIELLAVVHKRLKAKALELSQSSSELNNPELNTLYPMEHLRLWLWTEQFERIIAYCASDLAERNKDVGPSWPDYPPDRLPNALDKVVRANKEVLQVQIGNSALPEVEQEFLSLLLDFLTPSRIRTVGGGKSLNARAQAFADQHVDNPLQIYAQNQMVERWIASPTRFYFSLSGGVPILTDRLSNSFNERHSIVSSMGYTVDRHNIYLSVNSTFLRALDSIGVNGGAWLRNAKTSLRVIQLGYGYHLLQNRFIEVTPFAGAGLALLSSNNLGEENVEGQSPNIEDSPDLGAGYSFSSGLVTDITIAEMVDRLGFAQGSLNRISLRFRYQYTQVGFPKYNDRFKSGLHTISAGLVLDAAF